VSTTVTLPIAGKHPPRWKADLGLAIVALVWGSTFVIVKWALDDISTVYFLAIRFWIASLCMALMFARSFQRAGTQAVLRGLRGGSIAGVFLWLGYILQTFGLKYTSAGNSGFLTGLYIVLVPLISAAFFRRLPQLKELGGILIATAGMVFLTLPHASSQTGLHLHVNRGDILTIGCAVAFAFHLLLLGYYSPRSCFEAVALGQIVCAAGLSTLSLIVEPPHAAWSGRLVFAIVLTSVFATAIAFALQTWGQQYTTPTRTALIFALEPVFALVTAGVIGGEPVTVSAVIGGALILSGILLVELKRASEPD
jgi:drug/metabolite transporter (DMT)-like permease